MKETFVGVEVIKKGDLDEICESMRGNTLPPSSVIIIAG